jgi:hypothetical protein
VISKAAAASFPALLVQPSLESRGDQLGDAVAPEDDGGEASCNDGDLERLAEAIGDREARS